MVRKEKKSEILIFLVKSRSLRQVFGLVTLKISSKFQRGFETVQFCHFEHFQRFYPVNLYQHFYYVVCIYQKKEQYQVALLNRYCKVIPTFFYILSEKLIISPKLIRTILREKIELRRNQNSSVLCTYHFILIPANSSLI